jgi:phytoene/squalene synthetase
VKLSTSEPDHPVLIFLKKNAVILDVIQEKLLKIVDGFLQYSISPHFETFEEVVVHWMRTAGERELLLNSVLNDENVVPDEVIYQLMLLIEMVHYIQQLRLYTRHGVILFSADELRQFNVTQEMLREYVTTDAIKKLLCNQIEKVTRAYAVIKTLSPAQRRQLSHLIIRCEMTKALFDEIQKSDFCVLENLILLTPLRCAWIAFRSG